MIPFVIGLFIGGFFGFIFASILGMSRDGDEYARRKQYGRDLISGADFVRGVYWFSGKWMRKT